jgi:hypothetical protein
MVQGLTSDLPGYRFNRVRFALTGRHIEFLGGIVTSVPFDPTLPGRF